MSNERKPERSIRLSQGITTYGVGAIVGIGEESFINMDISKWEPRGDSYKKSIELFRLAQRLRVVEFKQPKPKQFNKKGGKFRFMRFPRMMFCPICRSMFKMNYELANELEGHIPTCMNKECKGKGHKQQLPMRFITVCENGHIDDFPWWGWAHSNADRTTNGNCQTYNQLKFETVPGAGASYKALKVVCKACGAERDLGGLEHNDALKEIGFKCKGKQPWQSKESASPCDETPKMVQRNASNIYQPIVHSAIDIPTGMTSDEENPYQLMDNIQNNKTYLQIKGIYMSSNDNEKEFIMPFIEKISDEERCSIEDVLTVLDGGIAVSKEDDPKVKSPYDIKLLLNNEEWSVFFQNISEKRFINHIEDLTPRTDNKVETTLLSLINHVSLVKRLREVRAFEGFSRMKFDPGKKITASLGRKTHWLPAIEVYGEGIFISINRRKLDEWYDSNITSLNERFKALKKRYENKAMDERSGPFSSKFILLHTLSHLLIRQLAFESGYNSSSLRENIYFSDENDNQMAGILIYTADSDSEGSLGGLVRQGEFSRLIPTIITALQRASWCSADPVCRESNAQGPDGLNKAACHACTLISETSCAYFNSLLDRSLLIDSEFGFFKDVYQAIEDES